MNQDQLKLQAAEAALSYIESGSIVGVGTGSTVNYFIDGLAKMKGKIDGAVISSLATKERLQSHGIPIIDLNSAGDIPLYVDGADEVNQAKQMVKGGGGALAGEKIVAAAAKKFICIVDESKQVDLLGSFPVPIEVIPMARSLVARQLVKLGGDPAYRRGFVSDYGNVILDVHNLSVLEPVKLEEALSQLPGVVTCGLFAKRPADVVLVAGADGVVTL